MHELQNTREMGFRQRIDRKRVELLLFYPLSVAIITLWPPVVDLRALHGIEMP